MVKDIVYGLFGNIKGHTFFLILAHQVAIFTSQLAVFCDNERNVLCHARLPVFNNFHHLQIVLQNRIKTTAS
jgi:hypothetical protein